MRYQDTSIPIKLFNNEGRNMMNKLWANVKFKNQKNAEQLIRAFFQNFNAEISITLKGNEAKMKIVFREPPMEIVTAIAKCKDIELGYGENSEEYEEDEDLQLETQNDYEKSGEEKNEQTNSESKKTEQDEQTDTESEKSEQTKQPIKKRGETTNKNAESNKEAKTKPTPITIPELEEIAKKASSFEHFAKLVAEWLEMNKKQEFFTNLVIVSAEVDNVTWKEVEKALKSKGIVYTQSNKIWVSNKVSEKLKKYSATIIPFLNATRQYKEYPFKQVDEDSKESSTNEQTAENTMSNVEEKIEESDESTIDKPRVKMGCMPEIKNFEEILASVDKTQPVEERIRYVLEAMGLNKMPVKEQEQIVKITSAAVRKRKNDYYKILMEANIPNGEISKARMIFSQFINNFVQKYEENKKVKLMDFLYELQMIIMNEDEIESL